MAFLRRIVTNRPVSIDVALLVIRLGIGSIMAFFHGYGKISGGPELWARIGDGMGHLGITFAPALWGFMASFAEFCCSILLILGVLFRPAAALLAFTMFVAVLHHVNLPAENANSGLKGGSHALELMVVYVGLFLAGPGRYTLALIRRKTTPSD